MAPVNKRPFSAATARRALAGGRAPGCWRRALVRGLEGLRHLRRACAWLATLSGQRPRLRPGPLWGSALSEITLAAPAQSPSTLPAPGSRRFALEEARATHPSRQLRAASSETSRTRPAHRDLIPANGAVGRDAMLPARLPQRATSELLAQLSALQAPGEKFAPPRDQDRTPRQDASPPPTRQHPPRSPLPDLSAPSAQGQGHEAASHQAAEVSAWRRHLQAKARRRLHQAVQNLAAKGSASGANEGGTAQPAARTRGVSAPAPVATILGGDAAPFDPWRQTLDGPTLDQAGLAVLAAPARQEPKAPPDKAASRRQNQETAGQTGQPGAPAAAPQPRRVKAATGQGATDKAPTSAADLSLRDMLRQSSQRGEEVFFPRWSAPAGATVPGAGGTVTAPPTAPAPAFSPLYRSPGPKDPDDELDHLAEQMQRILREQARRHGIDL